MIHIRHLVVVGVAVTRVARGVDVWRIEIRKRVYGVVVVEDLRPVPALDLRVLQPQPRDREALRKVDSFVRTPIR